MKKATTYLKVALKEHEEDAEVGFFLLALGSITALSKNTAKPPI